MATPQTSTQPSQGGVTLTSGVALTKAVRKIRFDGAGTLTYTDFDGYTSPTLTVVAGETWIGENIVMVTFGTYTGAVTGTY